VTVIGAGNEEAATVVDADVLWTLTLVSQTTTTVILTVQGVLAEMVVAQVTEVV